MGVRSGGSEYELLILDKGKDSEGLDKFLSDTKVCGWDGYHFHGNSAWSCAYPEYDYRSDANYPVEQLTVDYPGCVLFGWVEHDNNFSCIPEYNNVIIVNGKEYCVSNIFVDGFLLEPQFCKDPYDYNGKEFPNDLIIDFYFSNKRSEENNE